MFSNVFYPKKTPHYFCEICQFETGNKKDYRRHLSTDKHKINVFENIAVTNQNKKPHTCFCGKSYKDYSGLWRHKKKCQNQVFNCCDSIDVTHNDSIDVTHNNCELTIAEYNNESQLTKLEFNDEFIESNKQLSDKELVMMLIKDNTEMKKMMMEILKNGINNTNCNNTTNKTFNLNLYLNETCKDAMNISDFVNSISLSLEDLEHTGRKGYVEGISSIFLKNLNNIEHHMRPIHCSDSKREILYIKDNDKWEKECEGKPILTNAIKKIAKQNICLIQHWRNKYPDCTKADSRKNDLYLKIVSNSMNGLTEEEGKRNIDKIISNVAKEVLIDKY